MNPACRFTLLAQTSDIPTESFPGFDGFLGSRGSLMMDIVVLAMLAFVPLLGWSIWLVRYRQRYELHKRVQLILGAVLFLAVALFELDVQFVSPWEPRAEPSPHFDPESPWSCPAGLALLIHLSAAVPTALLWVFVIVRAVQKFPHPTSPGPYSAKHIVWARIAAIGMCMTAATGWVFYYLAFAA